MELKNKELITRAINSWLEESSERSASKLAERSEVAAAYISKIRNGDYEMPTGKGKHSDISDKIFNKLAVAIGLDFNSQMHWETDNYMLVHKMCSSAQNKHQRILLDGFTGGGKTYALERYSVENDNVLYIKVTNTMGANDILDEIIKKLGIREFFRGNRKKMIAINRKVVDQNGFLIIIDEAEYLKRGLYNLVKEIADFTDRRCGMILSGCGLISKIATLADNDVAGFKQLKRRFFPNREELEPLKNSEIRHIATSCGITNTTALNVICKFVYDYDSLRNIIEGVIEIQEREDTILNGQDLINLFHLDY